MIPMPPVQYLRGKGNIIEVAITGMKLDDGRVAFGFAYRSYNDPPDKAIGGYLATKRAVGMVHAADNGVIGIYRDAHTPLCGLVVKAFLGAPETLIEELKYLNPRYEGLSAKVQKIVTGMNRNIKEFRNELAKEE